MKIACAAVVDWEEFRCECAMPLKSKPLQLRIFYFFFRIINLCGQNFCKMISLEWLERVATYEVGYNYGGRCKLE